MYLLTDQEKKRIVNLLSTLDKARSAVGDIERELDESDRLTDQLRSKMRMAQKEITAVLEQLTEAGAPADALPFLRSYMSRELIILIERKKNPE